MPQGSTLGSLTVCSRLWSIIVECCIFHSKALGSTSIVCVLSSGDLWCNHELKCNLKVGFFFLLNWQLVSQTGWAATANQHAGCVLGFSRWGWMTGRRISRVISCVSLAKCVQAMWVDEVVVLEERPKQSSNKWSQGVFTNRWPTD